MCQTLASAAQPALHAAVIGEAEKRNAAIVFRAVLPDEPRVQEIIQDRARQQALKKGGALGTADGDVFVRRSAQHFDMAPAAAAIVCRISVAPIIAGFFGVRSSYLNRSSAPEHQFRFGLCLFVARSRS
ncbi:MAG: hypothetical protein R3D69_10805 [Xanthobacteraceae bacterium]